MTCVRSKILSEVFDAKLVPKLFRFRTFEGHVDIWCCWILESPTGAVRQPSRKLTAWKGSSSSYKAIPVDLPAGRKAGQSWRLALWVPGRSSSSLPEDVIDLCPVLGSAKFGISILPVTSSPILFGQGGKKEGPKQERIWRSYALPISPPTLSSVEMTSEQTGRPLITIVEQTSFDLDKVRFRDIVLCPYDTHQNLVIKLTRKYGTLGWECPLG